MQSTQSYLYDKYRQHKKNKKTSRVKKTTFF
jgi:hypothetical protein